MRRILRNLMRLPARTWTSARRWLNPVYRLERQADWNIRKLISPARQRELEQIPATSSIKECRLLAWLTLQAPPTGCIVEIGAFKGKSTAWLVEAAQLRNPRPTVVSIDPHLGDDWHPQATWEDFLETCRKFQLPQRGLEVQRAKSHDVGVSWRRPIALLWVDGSHHYGDVCNDILDFVPHVVEGGWIVFDDAGTGHKDCWPGVWRAIQEHMFTREDVHFIGLLRHLAIFKKLPAAQRAARASMRAA